MDVQHNSDKTSRSSYQHTTNWRGKYSRSVNLQLRKTRIHGESLSNPFLYSHTQTFMSLTSPGSLSSKCVYLFDHLCRRTFVRSDTVSASIHHKGVLLG